MTWDEATPAQRDEMVATKVMGWVPGICDGEMGEQPCSSDGWFCQKCGHDGYWGDDFEHEQLPPHYTASMDAAWKVIEHFIGQHPYSYIDIERGRQYMRVCINVYPNDNIDLPILRYSTQHSVPSEALCLVALRAVGEIIEN
jgi:hypothetical protein